MAAIRARLKKMTKAKEDKKEKEVAATPEEATKKTVPMTMQEYIDEGVPLFETRRLEQERSFWEQLRDIDDLNAEFAEVKAIRQFKKTSKTESAAGLDTNVPPYASPSSRYPSPNLQNDEVFPKDESELSASYDNSSYYDPYVTRSSDNLSFGADKDSTDYFDIPLDEVKYSAFLEELRTKYGLLKRGEDSSDISPSSPRGLVRAEGRIEQDMPVVAVTPAPKPIKRRPAKAQENTSAKGKQRATEGDDITGSERSPCPRTVCNRSCARRTGLLRRKPIPASERSRFSHTSRTPLAPETGPKWIDTSISQSRPRTAEFPARPQDNSRANENKYRCQCSVCESKNRCTCSEWDVLRCKANPWCPFYEPGWEWEKSAYDLKNRLTMSGDDKSKIICTCPKSKEKRCGTNPWCALYLYTPVREWKESDSECDFEEPDSEGSDSEESDYDDDDEESSDEECDDEDSEDSDSEDEDSDLESARSHFEYQDTTAKPKFSKSELEKLKSWKQDLEESYPSLQDVVSAKKESPKEEKVSEAVSSSPQGPEKEKTQGSPEQNGTRSEKSWRDVVLGSFIMGEESSEEEELTKPASPPAQPLEKEQTQTSPEQNETSEKAWRSFMLDSFVMSEKSSKEKIHTAIPRFHTTIKRYIQDSPEQNEAALEEDWDMVGAEPDMSDVESDCDSIPDLIDPEFEVIFVEKIIDIDNLPTPNQKLSEEPKTQSKKDVSLQESRGVGHADFDEFVRFREEIQSQESDSDYESMPELVEPQPTSESIEDSSAAGTSTSTLLGLREKIEALEARQERNSALLREDVQVALRLQEEMKSTGARLKSTDAQLKSTDARLKDLQRAVPISEKKSLDAGEVGAKSEPSVSTGTKRTIAAMTARALRRDSRKL